MLSRLAPLAALILTGCAAWRPAVEADDWTLYVREGDAVATDRFTAALEPAVAAVEARLGPFERPVRVHAWHGGLDLQTGNRGRIVAEADEALVQEVAGIGPMRVRAFHARGGGPFSPTPAGVFLGEPDAGSAVHELVHARLVELSPDLPLWFEEGVATLLGDGALVDGEWVTDGFACWPWRELREERLDAAELARLTALTARDEHSVRDNLLVHFVGWALVFDLAREAPGAEWSEWLATARAEDPERLAERVARTLDEVTVEAWLTRLDDPDPGVRLAAARGTWKLGSEDVLARLERALRSERDDRVRAALVINALAAAGKTRVSWSRWQWLRREAVPALAELELTDPTEARALRTLHAAYEAGRTDAETRAALDALAAYWEE